MQQTATRSTPLVGGAVARELDESRETRARWGAIGRHPKHRAEVIRAPGLGGPVKRTIAPPDEGTKWGNPLARSIGAGKINQGRQGRAGTCSVGGHPKHRSLTKARTSNVRPTLARSPIERTISAQQQRGVGADAFARRFGVGEFDEGGQGRTDRRAVGRHPKDCARAADSSCISRSVESAVVSLHQSRVGSGAFVGGAIARELDQCCHTRARRCAVRGHPEHCADIARAPRDSRSVESAIVSLHQSGSWRSPLARGAAAELDQGAQRRRG